jgi:glycosyltransferase involved in cell wall biosynthesis
VPEATPDRAGILTAVRGLVVTNMYPSAERPAFGSFVRDQVEALRALGADVEVFFFEPGGVNYLKAIGAIRRAHAEDRFDVVHAHFGLSLIPALALRGVPHVVTMHGTDLHHRVSGPVSRLLARGAELPATASATLAQQLPGAGTERRVAVLPCGVDLRRFHPEDRAAARARLGLEARGRYLLLPADPSRPVKRADRARALAARTGATLLTLGGVAPDEVPHWVNAANAVCVPSDHEGFGLAALEALACDVPVLSTPVGVAPVALGAIAGTHVGPWDETAWAAAAAPHLDDPDPRIRGRDRAAMFGAERMAERVLEAWRALVAG